MQFDGLTKQAGDLAPGLLCEMQVSPQLRRRRVWMAGAFTASGGSFALEWELQLSYQGRTVAAGVIVSATSDNLMRSIPSFAPMGGMAGRNAAQVELTNMLGVTPNYQILQAAQLSATIDTVKITTVRAKGVSLWKFWIGVLSDEH